MTEQTGNNKPNEAEGLAFPLSGNEKLIEEAAKAMADGEHNVLGWRGHSEDGREWYRKEAAIALAVFEKALTPTGATEHEPTQRTSNFGWAIWHLTKAKAAQSLEEAQMHAVAASARAQLQVAAEMGATRGVDPNGPTEWQEDWS